MDYILLGSELTDLIREWIKEERLNAPDVALPLVPSDPSTRDSTAFKTFPAETSEQPSVVEVDEVTVVPNSSITPKVPATEKSLSVTVV